MRNAIMLKNRVKTSELDDNRERIVQLELDLPPPRGAVLQLWTPDDIYDNATPEQLLSFIEDRRIEFKSAKFQSKSLGDYVAMWANTQPSGGIIVIGVEKNGVVMGCNSVENAHINDLEKASKHYCPDAKTESKRLAVTNHKGAPDYLLVIRSFYREDKLVETVAGEAFIRIGDEKRLLQDSEKREIRIAKREIQYELEPISEKWPDAFDADLVAIFASSYRAMRGLSLTHTNEQILELNKLGKNTPTGFAPNFACGLLFLKDPTSIVPGAKIRFLKFDSDEEGTGKSYNVVKDNWIFGPIPKQIVEIRSIVKTHMREFTRLGKEGRFYTLPEYPEDAWTEAIVNATVHRSYNHKNMNIFVKMFNGKMIIESPGGFPPPTNADNIYDAHNPRNPFLMEALYYLDFVKCAHEGTRRMRDAMAVANLPAPRFQQKEVGSHQVHVTLQNDVAHTQSFIDGELTARLGKNLSALFSKEEKMIINYFAIHPSINVSDASRLLYCNWHTAKKKLEGLVTRQVLSWITKSNLERDPSAHYVLKKNDDVKKK